MNESEHPEVVVITGATAGVGRATTRRFAREGAHIGLLARGEEGLQATKREVEAAGGKALAIPTDVADAEQVEKAARQVEDELGPIDIWINNAMATVFSEFIDVEPEDYRRVTDVCYHGTVHGTQSALKRMLPRDRGVIVQVGSALAYRGIPLQSAYCGAKHAIQGMFDSVRSELIANDSNVHMTMVQLPAINTPQFDWSKSNLPRKGKPVPPIFQPEVAADSIYWAAHHRRREVYLGWPTTQAIVGNKLAPGVGDWYLARNGYEDQQRDEPEDPNRPNNLWEPVEGDFGAHGSFDDESTPWSLNWWTNKNRRWLALAGAGLAGIATFLLNNDP